MSQSGVRATGTFYYMNQKHVVYPMCALVFVRDRKRHAIPSLDRGSLIVLLRLRSLLI